MATTLHDHRRPTHRELPDTARTMAKADLRNAENATMRALVGRCIDRARRAVGWSLKEMAAALHHDERQVARWISGAERAQLDVLWSVDALRSPLVVALAECAGGVDVVTTIQIRRSA